MCLAGQSVVSASQKDASFPSRQKARRVFRSRIDFTAVSVKRRKYHGVRSRVRVPSRKTERRGAVTCDSVFRRKNKRRRFSGSDVPRPRLIEGRETKAAKFLYRGEAGVKLRFRSEAQARPLVRLGPAPLFPAPFTLRSPPSFLNRRVIRFRSTRRGPRFVRLSGPSPGLK